MLQIFCNNLFEFSKYEEKKGRKTGKIEIERICFVSICLCTKETVDPLGKERVFVDIHVRYLEKLRTYERENVCRYVERNEGRCICAVARKRKRETETENCVASSINI